MYVIHDNIGDLEGNVDLQLDLDSHRGSCSHVLSDDNVPSEDTFLKFVTNKNYLLYVMHRILYG